MKKNKIFINKLDKKMKNNQSYTNVSKDEKMKDKPIIISKDNTTVEDKLNKLFQRNGYIFNVDVKIITNNEEYDTKIASKIKNNIITLDNHVINISDIKDIIIKN